jgi:hypothetical protein
MPDNQAKTNKYTNASEALDLRENASKETGADVERIELPPLPEQLETTENIIKSLENRLDKNASGPEQASPSSIITAGQRRQKQEMRYRKIENVLADGLDDLYLGMDQISQQNFKKAGEEAGKTIDDLISRGKGSVKKIVEIIKKWLSLIPGVNKFFLEQEAKIKADKIMKLQKPII